MFSFIAFINIINSCKQNVNYIFYHLHSGVLFKTVHHDKLPQGNDYLNEIINLFHHEPTASSVDNIQL